MSGFYGADVEQLRALGRELAVHADLVRSISARLTSRVETVAWLGPDAQRFRAEWASRLSTDLKRVASELTAAADKANKNATEQEVISSGSGGVRANSPETGTPPWAPGTQPQPVRVEPQPEEPRARHFDPRLALRDAAYMEGRDWFLIDGQRVGVNHNWDDPTLTFIEVDGRRIYVGDPDWPPPPARQQAWELQ